MATEVTIKARTMITKRKKGVLEQNKTVRTNKLTNLSKLEVVDSMTE